MFDLYDNDFERAFDEAVDAIEKKEHRLIWADALKRHYAWWKGGSREMTMDEAKNDFDTIIDLQPTAEPIKHGRWIESWGGKWHSCSVCGGIPPFNFKGEDIITSYCPHCGAKMDEVENG